MKKTRRDSLLYWGILACAALLYAVLATSDYVWADEAYTFAMIRHSFPEIWKITAADVHPPLYYFAAKIFGMALGYNQFAMRYFSSLFFLAILAIGGDQISKLFNRRAGISFMLLFLLYPFSLEYAAEVRMYPMAALAVFLNGLFAYRAWKNNNIWDWVGFALAGTCAAYTHYFALVSVGVIYGITFLCILFGKRQLWKPWLAASLVTVALYLPWLKCFVEQLAFKVNNEYWIAPITFSTMVDYVFSLLHANGFGAFPLFFGAIVLILTVILLRSKSWPALLALAVPVATAVLGIGVSLAVRPIFIARYLVPCAPLLMFFLALGLSRLSRESWYCALIFFLLVSFAGNMLFQVYGILPKSNKISAAFVSRTAQAEAYVVNNENSLHISQVLAYYQPVTPIFVPDELGADNPYPNKYELSEFSTGNLSAFVILTDVGMEPDSAMAEGFQKEYLGTYFDLYNYVDAWMMTK